MGWAVTCDGDVKGHMRNSEDSNHPGEEERWLFSLIPKS